MPVTVRVTVPTLLMAAAGGSREVKVQADTVAGALDALIESHPKLRVHVFDEQGEVRQHVHVFYNDRNIEWLDSLDLPLEDGDTITVLQAVSGG